MTQNPAAAGTSEQSESGDAAALAQRYLALWTEYWSACLIAPETASLVAQILKPLAGGADTGLDAFFAHYAPRPEPAPFRAAPHAGGDGADELESRIAALERRLAALEAGAEPGLAKHPRKPGGRPRKA